VDPAEALTLTSSAFSTNFLAGQSRVGIKIDGLGSVENGPSYTSSTTTWTIPAGTADGGRSYSASVEFDRMVDVQSPILGGVAFATYMTVTEFTIQVITPQAPSLTAQPASQTVVEGQGASFTAAASGNPTPTYRWQVSTDGGSTWTDLVEGSPYSNVTTGTLTITGATLSMSGNRYRCIATNSAGSIPSNAATLTVNAAPAKPWAVTATGSFQSGGKAGLLWFNSTTGETAIWLMNGLTSTAAASYAPGADWSVAGTGDFDGDGKTDLLWRNSATGGAVVWFMNGTSIAGSKWIYDSGTTWVPYKLADFNGDGKTDILWHNNVTGDYAFWLMNGSGELLGASGFAVASGWEIAQVADF